MVNRRRVVAVLLCSLAGGAAVADAAPRRATVAAIVDGDTIRVKLAGRTVDADLLGVRAATACGADGAATLKALLRRGTRVRLVRDGARRGWYVFHGSTFVNEELVALGVAKAADLDGLRRAGRLRAAQRSAKALRLGVWSCDGAATPRPPAPATSVDTPENRAELDRFVRGYRFTIRDEMREGAITHRMEMVAQFCRDGRLIISYSMGTESGSVSGTWKVHDVTQRDGQLVMGRFATEFAEEEDGEEEEFETEPSEDYIVGGRRSDGTAVFGEDEEQYTATRAKADAC